MKKTILMLAALTLMAGGAFACGQQPEKKEATTEQPCEAPETTECEKKECPKEQKCTSETTETAETAETNTQSCDAENPVQ